MALVISQKKTPRGEEKNRNTRKAGERMRIIAIIVNFLVLGFLILRSIMIPPPEGIWWVIIPVVAYPILNIFTLLYYVQVDGFRCMEKGKPTRKRKKIEALEKQVNE
jgi:amino acid transporter